MTDLAHLESVIEAAWEDRANVSAATHGEAVERELVTQLWSMDQGDFAERLAALSKRIRVDPTAAD